MRHTAREIADLVGGILRGDGEIVVTNAAGIDEAGKGDVSFAQKGKLAAAASCGASALLVPEAIDGFAGAQIVLDDPYGGFVKLLAELDVERRPRPTGIHPTAVVADDAEIGEGVAMGPHCVVESGATLGARTALVGNVYVAAGSAIGADCVIYPGVVIMHRVRIGDRVIIDGNTTIGGDGFGFLDYARTNVKVPQVGRVEIGDDVEIGCNCTIDRATMDATVIGDNVKMDDHCHLAHNVKVGDHSILVAYARIGGGTVIGRHCVLAEDVGVTDNVTLGDGVVVAGTGKVSKNWPAGEVVWGNPAQPIGDEKRERVAVRRLPKMLKEFGDLKRALKDKGLL